MAFYMKDNGAFPEMRPRYNEGPSRTGYIIVMSRSFYGYTIQSPSGDVFDVYMRNVPADIFYLSRHGKIRNVMISDETGKSRRFGSVEEIYDYISGTVYGKKPEPCRKKKPSITKRMARKKGKIIVMIERGAITAHLSKDCHQ